MKKVILAIFIGILTFMGAKQVFAEELETADKWHIYTNEKTLHIDLNNQPDPYDLRRAIGALYNQDKLNTIEKVKLQGSFSRDNENDTTVGVFYRLLWSDTLEEVEFANSNFVPSRFFAEAKNLQKYADDGSVTDFHIRSFQQAPLQSIDSRNLKRMAVGAINNVQIAHLKLESLEEFYYSGDLSFAGNTAIQSIDFPALKTGTRLIDNIPNLEAVNLPKLENVGTFMGGDEYKIKRVTLPAIKNIGTLGSVSMYSARLMVEIPHDATIDYISSNKIAFSETQKTHYTYKVGEFIKITAFDQALFGRFYNGYPVMGEDRRFRVKWKKDGEWISPEGNQIFQYTRGKASDSGTYQAFITQFDEVVSEFEAPIIQLDVEEEPSGELSFSNINPYFLFQPYQITGNKALVKRKDATTGITVSDTRSKKEAWELRARIEEPLKDERTGKVLDDALVYKDETGKLSNLTSESLLVYQSGALGEEETEIKWPEDQGILVNIPANASASSYQTKIYWDLASTPD
ncbi:hypothetical protein HCA69_02745 [Listeria grandensis]|uniref:WxL domain-containing protein n=1 Tax=Listeria grandensis TaxID=1494963 RepID=A0A7X0Y1F9_9LIST|nr:hypothetical protein [Listeria grandensis]MBC1935266.1 hypothetical protein [Listeria grandensis]